MFVCFFDIIIIKYVLRKYRIRRSLGNCQRIVLVMKKNCLEEKVEDPGMFGEILSQSFQFYFRLLKS